MASSGEENKLHDVAGSTPTINHPRISQASQCGFEGKAVPFRRMVGNLLQHYPTRTKSYRLGTEWRNAGGDEVGIDEHRATGFVRQELAGESCFSGTVRAGDDDNLFLRWHVVNEKSALAGRRSRSLYASGELYTNGKSRGYFMAAMK